MKWIFILFLPILLLQGQTAPPSANRFVGNAACKTCHPDVWLNFYKNPHVQQGCEGCHGPGGEHVDAHGGEATIKAFSVLSPAQTLDTCLGCHSKDISRANIRRSPHTDADVVCTNCHSIHKPATPKFLLAKQQTQLCYQLPLFPTRAV